MTSVRSTRTATVTVRRGVMITTLHHSTMAPASINADRMGVQTETLAQREMLLRARGPYEAGTHQGRVYLGRGVLHRRCADIDLPRLDASGGVNCYSAGQHCENQHTVLVTLAGQEILIGKLLRQPVLP